MKKIKFILFAFITAFLLISTLVIGVAAYEVDGETYTYKLVFTGEGVANDIVVYTNDSSYTIEPPPERDNYVFKDNNAIINVNKTNLNKYNTEVAENIILKLMGINEFVFADELKIYGILPKEVSWTPWLLYSALNKYGSKLKAIPSDTKFKAKNYYYAKPIILKNNLPVSNINELIGYLKKQTMLNDVEFYKFLKTKRLV